MNCEVFNENINLVIFIDVVEMNQASMYIKVDELKYLYNDKWITL